MNETRQSEAAPMKNRTTVEKRAEFELVVTRTFNGPVRIVFEAWSRPELFKRWWAPKSLGIPLLSCEMDVRTGGSYRLAFGQDASQSFAFFGKYIEVIPNARIVWTNEEEADGAVTTVTFEEVTSKDGSDQTLLTLSERYPTKEARDLAIQGSAEGLPEQFEQLDELLVALAAGA